MKTRMIITLFFTSLFFQIGCTEPYEIESVDFESVLVVESTITDEVKPQIVKLSKTSTLDDTTVITVSNASVDVTGDDGSSYSFSWDVSQEVYISDEAFSAQANVLYTLSVVTADGRRYTSSSVSLPAAVEIGALYAESINESSSSKDGVQVYVNTEDPSGNAKYFRYEFEETYKVVAPNPTRYITEIENYNPSNGTYTVVLTPREPEEVCYSTENSYGIIQTSTTELNENRVFRYPVRYLSKLDPKIQSRYSILVKQYIQSVEAYTFYKILNDLGDIGSLLSQGQPGYVAGNMISEANPDEKVLGFFEASSVSSKRIFFNYEDFNIEKPPFFYDCEVLTLDYNDNTVLDNDANERELIYQQITYYDYQVIHASTQLIYNLVQIECSVCTSISSNVRPDFWVD